MQCPTCHGSKTVRMFMSTGEDWRSHTYGPVDCLTCDGSGEVDEGYPDRRAAGEKMRAERIQRGESLMNAAIRLRLSPAELSAIENGRAPLNAGIQRAPSGDPLE